MNRENMVENLSNLISKVLLTYNNINDILAVDLEIFDVNELGYININNPQETCGHLKKKAADAIAGEIIEEIFKLIEEKR